MTSISDLITGSPSHKWDDNPEISGTVVRVEEKQQTDIETGEPKTWKDGKPMTQWVFTLQTPASADDDGLRNIYARGGKYEVAEGKGQAMLPAIVEAYKKAGINEMEGAKLTVRRTGKGVAATRGKNQPYLYSAKVEKGATPVPSAGPFDGTDDDF